MSQKTNIRKAPKINHIVRSFETDQLLLNELDIKNNKEEFEKDPYSFNGKTIISNKDSLYSFLSFMFDPYRNKKTVKQGRFNKSVSDKNIDYSYNIEALPSKCTIIFVSNKKEEINLAVENANEWASEHNRKIKFRAITGDYTVTKNAEVYADYWIDCYGKLGYHTVFIARSMADRSFSVGQLYNAVMLVNEPGYASAIQKMNRLATPDDGNPNKVAKMFWFNFKGVERCVPIYSIIEDDYMRRNNKKDINGKPVVTFLNVINIYEEQDDGSILELTGDKGRLFDRIDKNKKTMDRIHSISTNLVNLLDLPCFEKIKNFINSIDNKAMIKITNGLKNIKTNQTDINAGPDKKQDRTRSDDNSKTEKRYNVEQIIMYIILNWWELQKNYDFKTRKLLYYSFTDVVNEILNDAYYDGDDELRASFDELFNEYVGYVFIDIKE